MSLPMAPHPLSRTVSRFKREARAQGARHSVSYTTSTRNLRVGCEAANSRSSALMGKRKRTLHDELSLGLPPRLVIRCWLQSLRCDRGYVIGTKQMVLTDRARALTPDPQIGCAYLDIG